jgi:hypothetical protein
MNDVKNAFIILPRNFYVIERACTGVVSRQISPPLQVPIARPEYGSLGLSCLRRRSSGSRRLVAGHFYRWPIMSKPTDLRQEINSLFRVAPVTKLLNPKNLCPRSSKCGLERDWRKYTLAARAESGSSREKFGKVQKKSNFASVRVFNNHPVRMCRYLLMRGGGQPLLFRIRYCVPEKASFIA